MVDTVTQRLLLGSVILLALGYLIILTGRQLATPAATKPGLTAYAPASQRGDRAQQLEQTFVSEWVTNFRPARDVGNPFFSRPNPSAPPSPPKTTRPVELIYQGHYVTSQGEKVAYVLLGNQLLTGTVGSTVVAGFSMAEIGLRKLVLRDGAGHEFSLDFSAKTTIEVPAP